MTPHELEQLSFIGKKTMRGKTLKSSATINFSDALLGSMTQRTKKNNSPNARN